MTRLYGRCCVSFLVVDISRAKKIRETETNLLCCTLREWRESSVESRTFEEWAPSLRDSLMEYSLSELPRPWLRSYSSNVICDFQKGQQGNETTDTNCAYGVVEFWDPAVGNWQTRKQHQVDKGVDVTLFCKVHRQGALSAISCLLEVGHDVS